MWSQGLDLNDDTIKIKYWKQKFDGASFNRIFVHYVQRKSICLRVIYL